MDFHHEFHYTIKIHIYPLHFLNLDLLTSFSKGLPLAECFGKTKAFEETIGIDKHGTPPCQEEREDFPLNNCLYNLEPTGGVSLLLNGLDISFEYFLRFP